MGQDHSAIAMERRQGGLLNDIYRRHWLELCRYINKTFGAGPPEPEDVAQAAFTRFAALDQPERVENPRAFLFATARNLVVDQARRDQVRRRHAEATRAEGPEREADPLSPEEIVLQRERLAVLKTIIERLPGKRRRIFILNRVHHLTLAEIAANEGISTRAARGHIERALADIKAEMAKTFGAAATGTVGKKHNGKRGPKL